MNWEMLEVGRILALVAAIVLVVAVAARAALRWNVTLAAVGGRVRTSPAPTGSGVSANGSGLWAERAGGHPGCDRVNGIVDIARH